MDARMIMMVQNALDLGQNNEALTPPSIRSHAYK